VAIPMVPTTTMAVAGDARSISMPTSDVAPAAPRVIAEPCRPVTSPRACAGGHPLSAGRERRGAEQPGRHEQQREGPPRARQRDRERGQSKPCDEHRQRTRPPGGAVQEPAGEGGQAPDRSHDRDPPGLTGKLQSGDHRQLGAEDHEHRRDRGQECPEQSQVERSPQRRRWDGASGSGRSRRRVEREERDTGERGAGPNGPHRLRRGQLQREQRADRRPDDVGELDGHGVESERGPPAPRRHQHGE
jgi:hypothetical protein